MSDEDLRRLRHRWESTGDWNDWERWARATQRSHDRDPARLVAALARLVVLHHRRARLGRNSFPAEAEQEDRLAWIRDRIATDYERTLRRVGILGRLVPHASLTLPQDDWRAAGIRMGVGGRNALREARPLRSGHGRRASFLQSATRTPFRRGRTLSRPEVERIREALASSLRNNAHQVMVVEGGDVEIERGRIVDSAAAAAYAMALAHLEVEEET